MTAPAAPPACGSTWTGGPPSWRSSATNSTGGRGCTPWYSGSASGAAALLAAARERIVAAEDAQLEVAVMEEMPEPRPTYVLARGRYDAPRSEANRVGRDVPAAI